jgi:hypothetical protein
MPGSQRRGKGFEPSGGITHRGQHTLTAALTNGNLSVYIIAQSHSGSFYLRRSTVVSSMIAEFGDSWIREFGSDPRLFEGFTEEMTASYTGTCGHLDHHNLQWLQNSSASVKAWMTPRKSRLVHREPFSDCDHE